MKNIIITVIVCLTMIVNVFAQEKSAKEKKGDKYAFRYSFDKAIVKYSRAKNLTMDGQRSLAESHHNLNQDIESEKAYSILINNSDGVLPEDYYNYAMILKNNGKYEEASKVMDKFSELKPNDLRAKDYNANKTSLAALLKDDGKFKVNQLDVNSDAEDFGPTFYKDKVVFTSSRATPKMIKRNYNWTNKPFWDMYVSEVKDGQLKKAKLFDRKLNGKMHDGPASFSKDGTFMAFTRNNYKDKTSDKVVEIQIYFSNNVNGKWSTPVPFKLNNTGYSVGHPCLTEDGNTMYFTSDMSGGYGGADLYRTSKVGDGEWSTPLNLGDKINTEGDEMFPFIEENLGMLFFASNGRFGVGGMDIFMNQISGSEFGQTVNAGYPLNTQYDDFSAIADDSTKKGYFSSNRIGGSGNDDIYAFDILKELKAGKTINGIAKDINRIAIPKTFITLQTENGNVLDTLTTKEDGVFSFSVDSDKSFKLVGRKETYYDGDTVFNTYGKVLIVNADVTLLKKVVEEKVVAQKTEKAKEAKDTNPKESEVKDLGKILKLKPIYFDLDKYTIRSDAKRELDKVIKIMNENPAMFVSLSAHTDCRASAEYNQVLSDKRAKSTTDYIKKRITNPSRIQGKGYGESNLVNSCACEGSVVSDCVEVDFQKDRRTEFVILKGEMISVER